MILYIYTNESSSTHTHACRTCPALQFAYTVIALVQGSVFTGRRWLEVVGGGRRWSVVVGGGRRWSVLVDGGRTWSMVVGGGRARPA